jgi:hypothetical protein
VAGYKNKGSTFPRSQKEGKECMDSLRKVYYGCKKKAMSAIIYREEKVMALSQKEYEELRDKVISKFRILYKDALAMDMCEVPKDIRIRLLDDEVYLTKTKAIRASLFAQQLETLDAVLAGSYANSEKPTDQSATVLKALEMKQKLLLEDLNITKDDSNALNVTFVAMTKADFEKLETVEIKEGGNSDELGADFGASEDTDSFEARQKAKIQEKLKELDSKEH